jgi:ankyrin repeat domain-containing protein 50
VHYLKHAFPQEDVAVAYIYCNYKEQGKMAVDLAANLLQQLVRRNPVISDEIRSLYDHHIKEGTRPTLAEWSKLLQLEACRPSKTFIVIDALDECPESTRESFLAEIQKLRRNTYLFITSRHLSIERDFEDAAQVDIRASDEDVRRYLEDRIKKEHRLARCIGADLTLQETIIDTIIQKARGV